MGEIPDFYPVIASARYLGVAPWDLAGMPETAGCYAWVVWGLACQQGEADAERQRARHRQNAPIVRR